MDNLPDQVAEGDEDLIFIQEVVTGCQRELQEQESIRELVERALSS